jgi:hypothetical protein
MGVTVGVVGFVTAFSRTTAATLQGLSVILSGSFFAIQTLPLAAKIGLVLIVGSVTVLIGFALWAQRLL